MSRTIVCRPAILPAAFAGPGVAAPPPAPTPSPYPLPVHAERRPGFDRHVYPGVAPGYATDLEGSPSEHFPITRPERPAPSTAILILHGGDAPLTESTDAPRLISALQRLKRSCRLRIYEGGAHDVIDDTADFRQEMDHWFDRHVRDHTPPPPHPATPMADAA